MGLTKEEKQKIEEEEKLRAEARAKYNSPTTIEATSKKWKKMLLVSISMIILGFLFLIGSATEGSTSVGVVAFILLLTGLVFLIWSRFGAWWHNR